MRRASLLATFALAVAAVAPLIAAAPAAARGSAYRHYGACGLSDRARPAHVCPRKRPKGAFFRSRRADVHYTVCVRFSLRRTLCAKRQRAERGVLYVNRITSGPGARRITWFVNGKRVGAFSLRIER